MVHWKILKFWILFHKTGRMSLAENSRSVWITDMSTHAHTNKWLIWTTWSVAEPSVSVTLPLVHCFVVCSLGHVFNKNWGKETGLWGSTVLNPGYHVFSASVPYDSASLTGFPTFYSYISWPTLANIEIPAGLILFIKVTYGEFKFRGIFSLFWGWLG